MNKIKISFSTFQEHLRRHTGETPFVCSDCPQKFKTRNTYKRHLSTRHGKLLTASGIRILSCEEFAKIRTKPYRRSAKQSQNNSLQVDYAGEDEDLQMVQHLLDSADLDMIQPKNKSDPVSDDNEEDSEATDTDVENMEGDEEIGTGEGKTSTGDSSQDSSAENNISYYVPVGLVVNP